MKKIFASQNKLILYEIYICLIKQFSKYFAIYTSIAKPVKGSDYASQRTLRRTNKFLTEQLQNTSGHSEETSAVQTSKLVTSYSGKGWTVSCSNHLNSWQERI